MFNFKHLQKFQKFLSQKENLLWILCVCVVCVCVGRGDQYVQYVFMAPQLKIPPHISDWMGEAL